LIIFDYICNTVYQTRKIHVRYTSCYNRLMAATQTVYTSFSLRENGPDSNTESIRPELKMPLMNNKKQYEEYEKE